MPNKKRERVICVTRYSAVCPSGAFRAVILSDLHNRRADDLVGIVRDEKPDLILLPGDICEKMQDFDFDFRSSGEGKIEPLTNRVGIEFMRELANIAPTFYAFGNHEIVGCKPHSEKNRLLISRIAQQLEEYCGIRVLDDAYASFVLPSGKRIYIGGLTSGYMSESFVPNLEFLDRFSGLPGYKVLISHHPEYFPKYISGKNIDLCLSGHAHGGQIRIFGRGLYAPGQGFFPRYTSGVHTAEGGLRRGARIDRPAMIVSRGLANNAPIVPRVNNPLEIITVDFSV